MATRDEIEKLLANLQYHTIEQVLTNIKSGEATPQDIRNAITLLKDNGFTMRDIPNGAPDPSKFLEDINQNMTKLPHISDTGEIIEADLEDE